ncbi:MAG: Asp-tRNA(Asn)/Glu-tRNA(Gln) amidotransferase subunit GatC [Candidatus Promineifilaceae bacterium]|nr:Asp-tRNA(Asn)/Glu-tRNA(Gln) amidotransferase subunit GatC [Candidatus Promineifilaceae bacterium]
MSLSEQDVAKIASLARLALTAAEQTRYQEQLSAVLQYAQRLDELDLDDVPPTASVLALESVWREDRVEPSLPRDEALFNAAKHSQDQFHIQPVLDEE